METLVRYSKLRCLIGGEGVRSPWELRSCLHLSFPGVAVDD